MDFLSSFLPPTPRRLKGGSLGESRHFKRYLRTCISHNLKTLFVFVVQDTVSMRGAAKPSEHTVIWAKDAFIPSFHFQDLFRSSCDILLCKYCSARGKRAMEIQFTLEVVHYSKDEGYLFDASQGLEMTFSLWYLL